MSKHDLQLSPVVEPVQGEQPAAPSARRDNAGAPRANWEGYSPETLAALLDDLTSSAW